MIKTLKSSKKNFHHAVIYFNNRKEILIVVRKNSDNDVYFFSVSLVLVLRGECFVDCVGGVIDCKLQQSKCIVMMLIEVFIL